MAAGTEAGAFNSLWFLLLIPFVLIALAIVLTLWLCISRKRNARRRQSTLRNVPTIQAEAEAHIEKWQRKAASVRRSPSSRKSSSSSPADTATLERDLTRSLSTRSQRDVYVRTLKARQYHQQQQHTPHPTTFRLTSSQSDSAHDRRATQPPSRSANQSTRRPWTPELEDGTAHFADPDPSSSSTTAAIDPSHLPYDTQSDDPHSGALSNLPKRNYHQFRRQDVNELSVIGEAEADISEGGGGISPSASHPSTSRAAPAPAPAPATTERRLPLSPSAVLAGAGLVVASEPDSYAHTQDISDPDHSPFSDPPPPPPAHPQPRHHHGHRAEDRQASTTSTSGITSSDSHQTSVDGGSIAQFPQHPVPSETSDSGEGHHHHHHSSSSRQAKNSAGDAPLGLTTLPIVTASQPSGDDNDDAQVETAATAAAAAGRLDASPSHPSPGLTPTLTPRQVGGEPSGSPSAEDPNAKTPTMTSTPSPNALEREAEDAVPSIQPLGGGGGGSSSSARAASRDPDHKSSHHHHSGLGLAAGAVGGAASKYLAPILPNFLKPSEDEADAGGGRGRGRGVGAAAAALASPTKADSADATAAAAAAAASARATSPTNPPHPTRPRASMSSLRSALAAPVAAAQPMVPSRSATGGSTGGGGGGASTAGGGGGAGSTGAAAAAGGGGGAPPPLPGSIVPGGGAWTYTSRQSEWKTASSTSVSRGGGGAGVGAAAADPRQASTTSLASRASSREGHHSRPNLTRKTSHGVAGSIYREHFGGPDEDDGGAGGGGRGEEDDHSSRISHMLDEDEERDRERERSARERERLALGPSSPVGLERKASTASKRNAVAAALMRKSSSKSGRSSRAAGTNSRTSQA